MDKIRRFDIDSLRGISVLSVIIFHVDHLYFPNGYLGVDLFFVISGYVITQSIFRNIKNNKFSFFKFYLKEQKDIANFISCNVGLFIFRIFFISDC